MSTKKFLILIVTVFLFQNLSNADATPEREAIQVLRLRQVDDGRMNSVYVVTASDCFAEVWFFKLCERYRKANKECRNGMNGFFMLLKKEQGTWEEITQGPYPENLTIASPELRAWRYKLLVESGFPRELARDFAFILGKSNSYITPHVYSLWAQ